MFEQWAFWIILAVLFAIAELSTPSFFFLWFSIGSLVSTLTSLLIEPFYLNLIIFILVSFILWLSTRKLVKRLYKSSSHKKTYQDTIIKSEAKIISKTDDKNYVVSVGGEEWKAISEGYVFKKNEVAIVTKRESNILYIEKSLTPKEE